MGNWKQVQARIRKARTGADAPAKLEQLFLKTRDGMVAFELAKAHESGQRTDDAVEWYRKAYEHFGREEWRAKASEAIQRLGGTPPTPQERAPEEAPREPAQEPAPAPETPASVPTPRGWAALPDHLFYESEKHGGAKEPVESAADSTEGAMKEEGPQPGNVAPTAETGQGQPGGAPPGGKRRRRGRRGGRRHHGGGRGEAQPLGHVLQRTEEAGAPSPPPSRPAPPPTQGPEPTEESGWVGPRAEELRTRSGDPGLASRVARLEMQIRRLLACPPHKVSEADEAPAGPGVLLLSDSDLTTHYYICACDTLRIEIGRLTRAERGGRGRGREQQAPLRSRLAEHLEINETQVVKYLETHGVVRWLQLDEGAGRVAHFAIAALEPILNE